MLIMLIIVWLISREVTTVIEVPLFRVDKFVKFEEFDDKLSVHIKWLDGCKISLIPTYDHYSKIYISTVLPFYIDVYITFLLFRYQ